MGMEGDGKYWDIAIKLIEDRAGDVVCRWDRIKKLGTGKPKAWLIQNDLFHEGVSQLFISRIFDLFESKPDHTFLVLTGWAKEMCWRLHHDSQDQPLICHSETGNPLENVWLGVTVENQEQADERIPWLLSCPGKKFVSIEPMLGPIRFPRKTLGQGSDCPECGYIVSVDEDGCCIACGRDVMWYGIDQVILGGETGPNARPIHPDWVRSVRDQCAVAGVPFYFKQWGEWQNGAADRSPTRCVYIYGTAINFDRESILQEEKRSGIPHNHRGGVVMSRVGRKAAGRTLDDKIHDGLVWSKEK